MDNEVSNLVGVESGSEGTSAGRPSGGTRCFKPCWCGEWFGGHAACIDATGFGLVSNLVGVESGSEGGSCWDAWARSWSFKPCWCGEWFGGPQSSHQYCSPSSVFQTLLVWRVVRRRPARDQPPSTSSCFKPCWCGEWFGGARPSSSAASYSLFQTLLVWRVVRRPSRLEPCARSAECFKPCWCGEWFGGFERLLHNFSLFLVSNLVGVESGSEVWA